MAVSTAGYFGQHVDERVKPQRPDLVARAIVPDYSLGNHTASLGLTFYTGDLFSASLPARGFHRPARLLEPQAAQRLQGALRPVRKGQAIRAARGHADRVCEREWRGLGQTGRRR